MKAVSASRPRWCRFLFVSSLLASCSVVITVRAQVPGLVYTTSGYDNLAGQDAICWSAPSFYDKVHEAQEHAGESAQEHAAHAQQLADAAANDFSGKAWQTALVSHFVAGPTSMLAACPTGTHLHLDIITTDVTTADTTSNSSSASTTAAEPTTSTTSEKPKPSSQKLRTHQVYSYHFEFHLDVQQLRQQYQLSDSAWFWSEPRPNNDDSSGQQQWPKSNHSIALQLLFCPVNGNLCSPFIFDAAGISEASQEQLGGSLRPPPPGEEEALDHQHEHVLLRRRLHHLHQQQQQQPSTPLFRIVHQSVSWDSRNDHRRHGPTPLQPQVMMQHQKSLQATPTTSVPRRQVQELGHSPNDHNHTVADGNNDNVGAPPAPTIVGLLDRIERALLGNQSSKNNRSDIGVDDVVANHVEVDYDQVLGFPTRVLIAYDPGNTTTTMRPTYDEFVYFATLSNVQALAEYDNTSLSTGADDSLGNFASSRASATVMPVQEKLEQLQGAKALWAARMMNSSQYQYSYVVYYAGSSSHNTSNLERQAKPFPWTVRVHREGLQERVECVLDSAAVVLFSAVENHEDTQLGDMEHLHKEEYLEQGGAEAHSETLEEDHSEEIGGDDHDHDHNDEHSGQEDFASKAARSPIFFVDILPSNETSFTIHYDMQIEVYTPGDYLPLATVQFFMTNATIHGHAPTQDEMAALKFDVANLLHQRSVSYFPPILVNEVTMAGAIVAYVLIGISALIQLFCLVSTVAYRNNAVMKLSQGKFLIFLQVAGFIAVIGSVFYNPTSNWSCYISGPITFIPLQFMFAVVFGRLRRIICIMEPLMTWHRPKDKRQFTKGLRRWKTVMMMGRGSSANSGSKNSSDAMNSTSGQGSGVDDDDRNRSSSVSRRSNVSTSKLSQMRRCVEKAWKRKSLRQQYTEAQLWATIVIVTLPMVVIEVIGLVMFPPDLVFVMDDKEMVGRYDCGDAASQIYSLASTGVLFLTLFAALFQAYGSRSLPALFNEADSVSSALIASIFIACLGFGIIFVSDSPSGSPDLAFLMQVVIILVIVLNVTIRLTLPKLKLIWKGEKVVVSRMLSEHREKHKQEQTHSRTGISSYSPGEKSSRFASGISSGDRGRLGASDLHLRHNNPSSHQKATSMAGDNARDRPSSVSFQEDVDMNTYRPEPNDEHNSLNGDQLVSRDDSSKNIARKDAGNVKNRKPKKKLILEDGRAPPSKLTVNVVSHANLMLRINDRILSGLQVDREDWEKLKISLDEFQCLLSDVEFQ